MSACPGRPPITVRLGGRVLVDNPRLRLHEDTVRMPTGRESTHWKVDYKLRGVGVIPVQDDGRVLLGLHYRYCPGVWTWEIVAGGVEPGEDVEQTARRELVEEAGCTARTLEFLVDYHPAPGLGNEHFCVYIARGLERVDGEIDADEIAELKSFTWDEVQDLVARRALLDGLTLTSLHVARARGLI